MENGIQDLISEISKHEEIKAKLATQQQESQLKLVSKETILDHHNEEVNVLEKKLKDLESQSIHLKDEIASVDERSLLMTSNKQEMQRLVKSTDLKIKDAKEDLQTNKESLQNEINECHQISLDQIKVLQKLKTSKNNVLYLINSSKH